MNISHVAHNDYKNHWQSIRCTRIHLSSHCFRPRSHTEATQSHINALKSSEELQQRIGIQHITQTGQDVKPRTGIPHEE